MFHKWSTNLIPFGTASDRFCPAGYRPVISTREKILQAKQIEGLDGVELHYPAMFEEMTPAETNAFLNEVGLECSIVTPIMASDPAWGRGSLSNPDPVIRRDAIQRIKEAMDASIDLGAKQVNVWLGLDGFDYPFQVDYQASWRNLVAGISECACYNPEVRLCIEPKLKQPRTHSLLGTVSRVLLLIHDVGLDNVGCLLDTGHALFAYENLAEQVVLLQEKGKLFHLHFNDNYGDWDWDMVVGSVHYFEFVEMLFWIRQTGYEGWYSLDQFPQHEDPVKALTLSIRSVKQMERLLDQVDETVLLQAVSRHDYLSVREVLEEVMG
jgi:sugar phosphate isomerase/epimerase